ncbi:FCPA [Symbiodinium necroappetens]|uniref:FCPA protein n=1 Tax=Symbiodinium necroappetens TaxID=1628268 RepID=A0A812K9Z2_9DINO|nr:FCPA [Symbiodinium necroappetens]
MCITCSCHYVVAKSCASQRWRWQEEERVKKAQQQEVTALPEVLQVLEISLEAQRKFNQEQAGRQRKRAEARLSAQLEEDMAKQAAEAKLQQEEAEERKKRKQQEVAKQMAEAAKQAVEQKALQKQEEAKKAPEPPQKRFSVFARMITGAEAIQKIKDKQVASMAQPCAAMSDASDPGVCRDCKGQALAQYEAGAGSQQAKLQQEAATAVGYVGSSRVASAVMALVAPLRGTSIQTLPLRGGAPSQSCSLKTPGAWSLSTVACLTGAVCLSSRQASRVALLAKTAKTKKLPKREKGRKKRFEPSEQLGVTEPLGFWDPLGISPKDEQTFYEYRVCEIKHGRVAMMACIGAIGQHYLRFGWFSKTTWGEPMPSGFAAVFSNPAAFGMIVLTAIAGLLEFTLFKDDISKGAGNFGDPLRIGQYTDDMRNRELNNGRFAMFSIMGIIAAEGATGKDAIEQLGL